MAIQHPFKHTCHDLVELFSNTNDMKTFCRVLEDQSVRFEDRYESNDYKGDGFELLVEFFLKLNPTDNRMGVSEYNIVEADDDTGVDGYGVGTNGNPATVQVKYKSNKSKYLSTNDDHLMNFGFASYRRYGVLPGDTNNMLIITTAKGITHHTKDVMFDGAVRCIGYVELRELLDNNIPFWDAIRVELGCCG